MLSNSHLNSLKGGSGISDEIIEARGYRTITDKSELTNLGFAINQQIVPALLIPLYRPTGSQDVSQIRPDKPRRIENRKLKYEFPWSVCPVLDCPPVEMMRMAVKNPKIPLIITEGTKKADAAVSKGLPCASLAGVWNWRGVNEFGGKMVIPDLDDIAWNGRTTYLCYDNDVVEKAGVYHAMIRLAGVLKTRGAKIEFIVLPYNGKDKIGLDDYLLDKTNASQIYELAREYLPEPHTDYYRLNDQGIAHRIMDSYPEELVFDNNVGGWFVWSGNRWIRDRSGVRVQKLIVDHLETLYDEVKGLPDNEENEKKYKKSFDNYAKGYGNARKIQGVEHLLKIHNVEDITGFDRAPELLNCINGTLNLGTGEFYSHKPQDRLTVICPVKYEERADCELWRGFMEQRFPDINTRRFIQRMCGLMVTGFSPEKAFFIIRGDQDSGKTVFIETLNKILGDYANKVNKSTLMKSKTEKAQAEKSVALVGRRMVYVDESDRGDQIDAAFIKEVTGGDTTLVARRLYEQEFQCPAEFTICLVTNFRPRMTGEDTALWRRCYLIEFGESIPRENQVLGWGDLLKGEYPGILKWMIDGYQDWKENGLAPPEEVLAWTQAYQRDNDPLGKFVADNYDFEEGAYSFVKDVHCHFIDWAKEEDINLHKFTEASAFSRAVRNRFDVGDADKKVANQRVFQNLKLAVEFRKFEE